MCRVGLPSFRSTLIPPTGPLWQPHTHLFLGLPGHLVCSVSPYGFRRESFHALYFDGF